MLVANLAIVFLEVTYIEAISAMTSTWVKTPKVTIGNAIIAPVGPPFRSGGSRFATEPCHVSTSELLVEIVFAGFPPRTKRASQS